MPIGIHRLLCLISLPSHIGISKFTSCPLCVGSSCFNFFAAFCKKRKYSTYLAVLCAPSPNYVAKYSVELICKLHAPVFHITTMSEREKLVVEGRPQVTCIAFWYMCVPVSACTVCVVSSVHVSLCRRASQALLSDLFSHGGRPTLLHLSSECPACVFFFLLA